ncbi:MAG: oligosaccharide flippase family protein [Ignavibacteriales bacterium]
MENFASLSLLQFTNYLLPFITLPYLARVLGVEKFGVLAFAGAVVIYFETLTDFGFNYTATRDIAKNKADTVYISKIFSSVMAAKTLLMCASLIIVLILIAAMPSLKSNYAVILLTFLCIPGYIMFPEWFFQGVEKMRYITIMNFISKLIFTLLTFMVIREQKHYIYVPVLTFLGLFISGCISLYVIFHRFGVKFVMPGWGDITGRLKGSYSIFFNSLFPNLYNSYSTLILGYWGGSALVGIFDAGKKIINFADQAMQVLSRTFFPYLSRNMHNHIIFVKINLIAAIIFSLIFYFGAGFIVNLLFTEEFRQAVGILKIMAITPMLFFLISSFGTNYLILIKKDATLMKITMISSVIGFILSNFLIYSFSLVGAALTLVLSRLLIGILVFIFANKFRKDNSAMAGTETEGVTALNL